MHAGVCTLVGARWCVHAGVHTHGGAPASSRFRYGSRAASGWGRGCRCKPGAPPAQSPPPAALPRPPPSHPRQRRPPRAQGSARRASPSCSRRGAAERRAAGARGAPSQPRGDHELRRGSRGEQVSAAGGRGRGGGGRKGKGLSAGWGRGRLGPLSPRPEGLCPSAAPRPGLCPGPAPGGARVPPPAGISGLAARTKSPSAAAPARVGCGACGGGAPTPRLRAPVRGPGPGARTWEGRRPRGRAQVPAREAAARGREARRARPGGGADRRRCCPGARLSLLLPSRGVAGPQVSAICSPPGGVGGRGAEGAGRGGRVALRSLPCNRCWPRALPASWATPRPGRSFCVLICPQLSGFRSPASLCPLYQEEDLGPQAGAIYIYIFFSEHCRRFGHRF